MILLVDIGNSRIKWGYWHDRRLQDSAGMIYTRTELAQELDLYWQSLPRPKQVHVSCVADRPVVDALTAWTETHWQVQPQFAKVRKSAHGVINSYTDHTRLGIDRWLALIAVHNDVHNTACVIDCGTAITMDGLHADGRHMGGIILPGLELMRESLYTKSSALARPENPVSTDKRAALAQSTEQAVDSGCRLAAAGAIERVKRSMEEKCTAAVDYIITGGDAEIIMPELSFRPRHEPHLVLQGLAVEAGVDL